MDQLTEDARKAHRAIRKASYKEKASFRSTFQLPEYTFYFGFLAGALSLIAYNAWVLGV